MDDAEEFPISQMVSISRWRGLEKLRRIFEPLHVICFAFHPQLSAFVRTNKWVGLEGLDERTSGSLIPDTLQEMEKDEEFQLTGDVKTMSKQ